MTNQLGRLNLPAMARLSHRPRRRVLLCSSAAARVVANASCHTRFDGGGYAYSGKVDVRLNW